MMNCDTENICDIKIALTHNGRIRTFLRDDVTGISFPAYWDLPGSPCLDAGSVSEAASQHLKTYMNLNVSKRQVKQIKPLIDAKADGRKAYLCYIRLTAKQMEDLHHKQAGTRWRDMALDAFFDHPRTLPMLKAGASSLNDPSGRNGKVAA